MTLFRILLLALALALPSAAYALEPGEELPDPAQEARARTLSKELRCLVCRNESIDDSGADLARDLRRVVRERIQAGDDDKAVLAWMVARYGDFVLLRPPFKPVTWALWLAPPAILILAGGFLWANRRRRGTAALDPQPLDADEERRVADLLALDRPRDQTSL